MSSSGSPNCVLAAFFSDSFQPVLYRVPLGPAGTVPDPIVVDEIPLGGDFVHVAGEINANEVVHAMLLGTIA